MEIVIPPFDLKSISPIIIITIFAMIILAIDVFFKKTFRDSLGYLTFLVVALTGMVAGTQLGDTVYSFSNMYVVDNFSVLSG